MPKIDLSALPVKTASSYPKPYDTETRGRSVVRLGEPSGLTQFGVNLVTLAPGAKSSIRHWHQEQDEFAMITQGELMLAEDGGETPLGVGDCASFPAGAQNGHCLINRSNADAVFLVIGTHTPTETAYYPDIDMMVTAQNGAYTFTRKDGGEI